jgi:hypothetical protein
MHRAIRQLTNKHKDLSKQVRTEHRALEASATRDALTRHAETVWNFRQGTDQIPEITITGNEEAAQLARMEGFVALTRERVPSLATFASPQDSSERDAKAVALVRVLAAYDVLAERPYDEQQALVEAILRIFFPLATDD